MEQKRAVGSVLLGGTCWGIISVFIKPLSAAGLNAIQISAARLLLASAAYFAFLALRSPQKLKIRLRDLWMFLCTGCVCVALCNVLYAYSIVASEASVAVVLMYTSPVFILLFSALFFKERITPRKLIAMFITVVGCVCVAGVLGGSHAWPLVVIITGVGSGLTYGLYSIFGRVALKKYAPETVTAYTFLCGAAALAFFGDLPGTFRLAVSEPKLLFFFAGLAVVSTVMAFGFYTWGLKRMDPGKAGILAAIEPLVGAVVGMAFYGEDRGWVKILGIVLILTSIVLLELPDRKKAPINGASEK